MTGMKLLTAPVSSTEPSLCDSSDDSTDDNDSHISDTVLKITFGDVKQLRRENKTKGGTDITRMILEREGYKEEEMTRADFVLAVTQISTAIKLSRTKWRLKPDTDVVHKIRFTKETPEETPVWYSPESSRRMDQFYQTTINRLCFFTSISTKKKSKQQPPLIPHLLGKFRATATTNSTPFRQIQSNMEEFNVDIPVERVMGKLTQLMLPKRTSRIIQLQKKARNREMVEFTEDEAALYDRQIRLWGVDAQRALRSANVLVKRCGPLGAEICKNIVLSGVNSLTLYDPRIVQEEHSATNFLLRTQTGDSFAVHSTSFLQIKLSRTKWRLKPDTDVVHKIRFTKETPEETPVWYSPESSRRMDQFYQTTINRLCFFTSISTKKKSKQQPPLIPHLLGKFRATATTNSTPFRQIQSNMEEFNVDIPVERVMGKLTQLMLPKRTSRIIQLQKKARNRSVFCVCGILYSLPQLLEMVEFTEDEAALYDRQIRLWGVDAQRALRSANVLVKRCGPLGAEICKNIVLSGVNSLTLYDPRIVQEEHSATNFLLRTQTGDSFAGAKFKFIAEKSKVHKEEKAADQGATKRRKVDSGEKKDNKEEDDEENGYEQREASFVTYRDAGEATKLKFSSPSVLIAQVPSTGTDQIRKHWSLIG
eukprot:sb/3462862/